MNTPAYIIFNPAAGGGRAKKMKSLLERELGARFGTNYLLKQTTAKGDAILFAREAAAMKAALVIAVGGDGTVNEVVNGLLSAGKPLNGSCELGIVNCGSGRGVAQTLGLPGSITGQLDVICNSAGKPTDVGVVTFSDREGRYCERLFISECQAGLGGAVVSAVGMKLKKFGGTVAFGLAAVAHLFTYRATQMTLSADHNPPETAGMIGIVAGNGVWCAGGMRLTPDARNDDGLLDILEIREMGMAKRLMNFGKVYSGNHRDTNGFNIRKCREFKIDSERPVRVEADGELLGQTPCTIGIREGAVKVRY